MKIILVRIVFTEGERWTSKPSSLLTVTRKMGYVWPTLSRVSDSSTPLKKHVFNTTLHSTVNTEPAHGLHNFNFPGSPVETAGLWSRIQNRLLAPRLYTAWRWEQLCERTGNSPHTGAWNQDSLCLEVPGQLVSLTSCVDTGAQRSPAASSKSSWSRDSNSAPFRQSLGAQLPHPLVWPLGTSSYLSCGEMVVKVSKPWLCTKGT